jgi:Lon protease-like protein
MPAFVYRKPRDLPDTLPVFPLDGALLLPRTVLPLNIFEPRYLNMVDDALAGARLVGMIQTRGDGAADRPELQNVGCVGRLTSFAETSDGRYLISLTGVCRFVPVRELEAPTPYRQVAPGYDAFATDLAAPALPPGFDRAPLLAALREFLASNDLAADWSSIEGAPPEGLVNSLAVVCPFDPGEKQALLEAPTLEARAETLLTLMRLHAAGPDGGAA